MFSIRRTATPPSNNRKAVFVVGPAGREKRNFVDYVSQVNGVPGVSPGGQRGTGTMSVNNGMGSGPGPVDPFTSEKGIIGSMERTVPSSVGKLVIGIDGIDLPEEDVKKWDPGIKAELAALMVKNMITVDINGAVQTPNQVRAYV